MNTDSAIAISEIHSDIQAIEGNEGLYEETNFNGRTDSIDFIDFHIIHRIEGILQREKISGMSELLKRQAQQVKFNLEHINFKLFKQLQEKIRTGVYNKSSFKKMVHKYLGYYFNDAGQLDTEGYDNLDVFINGILSEETIPDPTVKEEPEMVFYQKTPARVVFEIAESIAFKQDDVFFDLGSGLGQVAVLINLISGTKTKGIEYEPAYVDYAKACASRLNLPDVEFININALKADFSQGTIFFMYTPFEGNMLRDMLNLLQKESVKRTIRIFTYGPCSAFIARQNWLNCQDTTTGDNPYKLYEFRSLDQDSTLIKLPS